MDHINLCKHSIIYQDKFSDIDRFLQLARDHDKIIVNPDLTLTIITPPSVPPSIEEAKQQKPFSVQEFMNQKEAPS
jgi:hypothetical protein